MSPDLDSAGGFRSLLIELQACSSALDWQGDKSLRCAYHTCQRGDWMLWMAARLEVDRKLIVRAACDCARLAWELQDTAGHAAIETAEAWCHGEATIEQVRAAASAAYAAYSASAYASAATASAASAASAAYASAASAAYASAASAAANAANAANAALGALGALAAASAANAASAVIVSPLDSAIIRSAHCLTASRTKG